jgi:hypothetical protein
MRNAFVFLAFLSLLDPLRAQSPEETPLEVYGRITDGENKLAGCEILVYNGNDRVGAITTDKGGKFDLRLALEGSYGLEFRKEGFAPKRIVIDTHMPKIREGVEVMIAPIGMDISLLEKAKYTGANTDDLDFPFAIVRWNKGQGAFVQDQEYTLDMQRTNGAILLMAGRVEKRSH